MNNNASLPRREVTPPTEEELRKAVPRGLVRKEFQVGVFVLLGVVSLLAALFLLTDPSTFRGRYLVTTSVQDAGGIRRGDPVQMRGVNIGRVHGFDLSGEEVVITLELEGSWSIPSGSRTRLISSGILGGRTVEVIPGTGPGRVRAGATLPGENVPGLLDLPADLGRDAGAVLERLEALLNEPTLEAVQEGAQGLRDLFVQLSALTEAQGAEVARLTASLNRSALGLEAASGSGEDLARAVARADSALMVATETSESLLRASSSLEVILGRMEAGEGTLGQLSTDSTLYDRLADAAEGVRALVVDIRENPGRYVKVEIF